MVRLDLEAPLLELVQQAVLRGRDRLALEHFRREGEHPQAPAAGDLGIERAEPARRGVARVGEKRLARLLALLVDALEVLEGQVDLAPHLHQRRSDAPFSRSGMSWIVRRFGVMSSPTRPLPRVVPRRKRPSS